MVLRINKPAEVVPLVLVRYENPLVVGKRAARGLRGNLSHKDASCALDGLGCVQLVAQGLRGLFHILPQQALHVALVLETVCRLKVVSASDDSIVGLAESDLLPRGTEPFINQFGVLRRVHCSLRLDDVCRALNLGALNSSVCKEGVESIEQLDVGVRA